MRHFGKTLFATTFTLAGLAFAPISMVASAAAAENILLNCFSPPQHAFCSEGMQEVKRRIEAATEGRVGVTVPSKSLAAAPDQYEAILGGVMDAGFSANLFINERTVGMQITQLPFVAKHDARASSVALWETYQKYFSSLESEFEGVVLLSFFMTPGSELWSTTDEPITSVENLASRKIYSVPGAMANLFKDVGSAVVAGPVTQMLESVSKGVVDGFSMGDWETVHALKLGAYTKSATVFDGNLFQPTFPLFINAEVFGRFSAEDQQAVKDALGLDFALWMADVMTEAGEKARAELPHIEVVEADAAFGDALKALAQPSVDAWKERAVALGLNGDEVLAYFDTAYDKALMN